MDNISNTSTFRRRVQSGHQHLRSRGGVRHHRRHPAIILGHHHRRLLHRQPFKNSGGPPHVLTARLHARIAQPGKIDQSNLPRAVHGSEMWISNNAPSMHVTCSDVGVRDCYLPSPGVDIAIESDKKKCQ